MEFIEVLLGCKKYLYDKFIDMSIFNGWILFPKIVGPIRKIFYESYIGAPQEEIIVVPIRGMKTTIECLKHIPGVIFMEPTKR